MIFSQNNVRLFKGKSEMTVFDQATPRTPLGVIITQHASGPVFPSIFPVVKVRAPTCRTLISLLIFNRLCFSHRSPAAGNGHRVLRSPAARGLCWPRDGGDWVWIELIAANGAGRSPGWGAVVRGGLSSMSRVLADRSPGTGSDKNDGSIRSSRCQCVTGAPPFV